MKPLIRQVYNPRAVIWVKLWGQMFGRCEKRFHLVGCWGRLYARNVHYIGVRLWDRMRGARFGQAAP